MTDREKVKELKKCIIKQRNVTLNMESMYASGYKEALVCVIALIDALWMGGEDEKD